MSMARRIALLLGIAVFLPAAGLLGAHAAPLAAQPHAGYVYPAGARTGTRVRIKVGGQNLRTTEAAYVSGGGVSTEVKLWIPPPRNLDGEETQAVRELLREARRRLREGGTTGGDRAPLKIAAERVRLLRHPYLDDMEMRTADELDEIEEYFFRRRNPMQSKRSIEETVFLELTVAPDAQPGLRELRLQTKTGISTPVRFRIDQLPEVVEKEPNDDGYSRLGILDLPVVLNGQILPMDVDRYLIRLHKGQRLVARVEARALVPFQADSVPGWMQATVALHDPDGREVAYADDDRYDPDPVLFYEVPKDGEYELVVNDAVMRGRDDFVYRVAVGELPHVTHMFPLGGRAAAPASVHAEGWNLGTDEMVLDTRGPGADIRETAWSRDGRRSNEVLYAVDDLPETDEREPNDGPAEGPTIKLPVIVNGRIARAGDVDYIRFEGRLGQEIVAEVRARALGSALDAVVRVLDEAGAVVAWNDDPTPGRLGVRAVGLQTHEADPALRVTLPRAGIYTVQVSDVRARGGPDHAYRLRISEPIPDAHVYMTPSSLNARAGERVELTAYAVRQDGFDDEIEIALADAEAGYVLEAARIPAGRTHARMTMVMPSAGRDRPIPLRFVARIKSKGHVVERACQPADNVMQAFLWRHLLPARETTAFILTQRAALPPITLAEKAPVRVSRGGVGKARYEVPGRFDATAYVYQLVDPPAGLSIRGVKNAGRDFVIEIEATRDTAKDERIDHLLIEVFTKPASPDAEAKRVKKRRRAASPVGTSIGYLPATPYRIP